MVILYACNSLTNFQYEVHAMTGNGSYVNLVKLACTKKVGKSLWVNLFSASFSQFEPLCVAAARHPPAENSSNYATAARRRTKQQQQKQQ